MKKKDLEILAVVTTAIVGTVVYQICKVKREQEEIDIANQVKIDAANFARTCMQEEHEKRMREIREQGERELEEMRIKSEQDIEELKKKFSDFSTYLGFEES